MNTHEIFVFVCESKHVDAKEIFVIQQCNSKLFDSLSDTYQSKYLAIKPESWPATFDDYSKYKKACMVILINREKLVKMDNEPQMKHFMRVELEKILLENVLSDNGVATIYQTDTDSIFIDEDFGHEDYGYYSEANLKVTIPNSSKKVIHKKKYIKKKKQVKNYVEKSNHQLKMERKQANRLFRKQAKYQTRKVRLY
jgi:hypothetical protein